MGSLTTVLNFEDSSRTKNHLGPKRSGLGLKDHWPWPWYLGLWSSV